MTYSQIVAIGLARSPEIMDGVRVAHVPVERPENVLLRFQNIFIVVVPVGTREEIGDRGSHDLFVLGGDEQCSDTDEL